VSRRLGRPSALAALICGASCSTLAPEPEPVECTTDDDCDLANDEVCAIDQGNICLVATLPPRGLLGLDIREELTSLRIDLRGADTAVERVTTRTPSRYRLSQVNHGSDPFFPGVRDTFAIDLRELDYFSSQNANETISKPLTANLTLSQESRIGQRPHSVAGAFPISEEEADAELPFEASWSHYTAADVDGDRPVILELRASEFSDHEFGIIHRILRRDQIEEAAKHSITVDSTLECIRDLSGEITILSKAGEPLENLDNIGLTVSLRYGDGVTSPATIQPAPASIGCSSDTNCPQPARCIDPEDGPKFCGCDEDTDCPSGQICYAAQNRCTLDLAGRDAFKRGDIKTSNGVADLKATIYSHCEGEIEEARELPLIATVDPTSTDSGLPRISFALTPSFAAAEDGDASETPIGGKLCLPHWRPATPVALALEGAPAKLHTADNGTFTCCGVECLSEATPGSKPGECAPTATITASGTFVLPTSEKPGEPTQWENAGCLPLYVADEEDPSETRFTRAGIACTPESCELLLSPGGYGDDEAPKAYDLRVDPPVGSIFRSVIVPAEIADGTTSLPTIQLPHRILLRGQVELAEDLCKTDEGASECSVSAQIMAERIRLPGEVDELVLGPHYYTAATFGDGDFVLPVNPGVYLLTALPQIGSQGGPAEIQIVDLRESSPLVDVVGGVPYADLSDPIILAAGQLVTVELDAFSSSTTVIPLDMASWSELIFEGMALDLSAPSTCYRYSTGDHPGCQIRRLRPGSTTLRPSQEKYVKFITRN